MQRLNNWPLLIFGAPQPTRACDESASAPRGSEVLLATASRAVYSAITGGRLVRVEKTEGSYEAPIEDAVHPIIGRLRRKEHASGGEGVLPHLYAIDMQRV